MPFIVKQIPRLASAGQCIGTQLGRAPGFSPKSLPAIAIALPIEELSCEELWWPSLLASKKVHQVQEIAALAG